MIATANNWQFPYEQATCSRPLQDSSQNGEDGTRSLVDDNTAEKRIQNDNANG